MKATLRILQPVITIFLACACLAVAQSLPAAEPLVICSPDGTHTATVGEQGRILYGNANDGAVEHIFYICHTEAVAFSENGKLLAAAGGRDCSQGKIKVWRIGDHKQLSEIVVSGESAKIVALATDDRVVITANANGTVEAWNVSDGKRLWSRSISPTVEAMRFAPGGHNLLLHCADGKERMLDSAKGRNLLQAKVTKE